MNNNEKEKAMSEQELELLSELEEEVEIYFQIVFGESANLLPNSTVTERLTKLINLIKEIT